MLTERAASLVFSAGGSVGASSGLAGWPGSSGVGALSPAASLSGTELSSPAFSKHWGQSPSGASVDSSAPHSGHCRETDIRGPPEKGDVYPLLKQQPAMVTGFFAKRAAEWRQWM